ncbi:uroporphyrinogen decarboxylase [Luteibaculum oceani]|uniref:Uroporphyrinogen decarboxylase n=1 Tax=Luteibaculum oceani TaxID=1294296 RepID=A0A5C6V9A0_9FLAO|nr:uroporphyrinogen decarboxylase [Luteibaculum oceani]TXC81707.1 uroporphyrinogen decarboxylase [Luteibaculum oceani]
MKNDLFLRAARGEQVERPPVWLMRQAGRSLPEYRAVRASVSGFKELVKNPQLAAEVTVQPVDILGVDAAIIFSDILVVPEAMGCNYEMVESVGPVFPDPISSVSDIDKLTVEGAEESLAYVTDALLETKKVLNGRVPLIGFAGAPFTIFTYMIEGKGSKTFSKAKAWLYKNPEASHKLLQKITDFTISYLRTQIKAGADLVQVFDSWAGVLSPETFNTFSLPYIQQICKAINEVPVTVFAKGAWFGMEEMSKLDCQVLGLDWNIAPELARKWAPNKTLQGNLDPCVLYGTRETVAQEVTKMIDRFGSQKYIVNLGHGVYPDTPVSSLKTVIETVKAYKK